ncbi:unnamed protein product [Rhizoctonia solani]|nr:unnamed protein product [Rhizoctonia solani]
MTDPQSIETHPHWGRTINDYHKVYNCASVLADLEIPPDETGRAVRRDMALRAIQQICTIDALDTNRPLNNELANRITLEKLQCILELTRFSGELDNFALPGLVAGCITLMLSIKPSPFYFEYGYLCFKILVISLDTCLLKRGRDPTEPLQIPNAYSPHNYLADLWTETALLIGAELQGYSDILIGVPDMKFGPRNIPHLKVLKLDALLILLHDNQITFTNVLKEADSLGLAGLMYILLKFVENKKADMDEEQYQDKLVMPFARILYRYRLFAPEFPFELDTMAKIINYTGLLVRKLCGRPLNVDYGDSRSVLKAYSTIMKTQESAKLPECIALTNFAAAFATPGCEDLVAEVIDAAMEVIWKWLYGPAGPDLLMKMLARLLGEIHEMLKESELSCANNQLWMDAMLQSILITDLLSLVLRIILVMPTSCYSDPESKQHIFQTDRFYPNSCIWVQWPNR